MQSLNWDDFRLIRLIAETRSLGGAAERLGINHSTVFRRLGALEEQLGVKLFERARVGYAPTAAGEEMVALAKRMGDDIVEFERRVAGAAIKPSGDLRVTTNDSMVAYLLAPVIAGFLQSFPDIRVEMIVGNQALNLSKRDADVAIRATDTPPETLVGRRIGSIAWSTYGTEKLVEIWKSPDNPDAPWIGYSDALSGVPAVRRINDSVATHRIVYRTTTVVGQAEAAAESIGFASMPCFVGDRFTALRRLTPPERESGRGLWLLTHPDLKQSARVRAFMDYAGAALLKRRGMIEGEG